MGGKDRGHKDHDQAAEKQIQHDVKCYGCHLTLVEADNYMPAFAYTIGLYKNYNHPEVICFGLSVNLMGSLLNTVKELIEQGGTVQINRDYPDFLEDFNVTFINVDKSYYSHYLGYANWFYDYKPEYPVLQLVWPDATATFPWNESFNPKLLRFQPLLDRNIDFKFIESRNLGVYTSSHVLEGEPILYVYHNEDGDWQFHSSDDPNIDDAKLVALEEIINIDPTVNHIFFLPYGWSAWRKNKNANWEYKEDFVKD